MAETVETMSFLAYWLSKLVAGPVAADNTLLIQQGDTVRQISIDDFQTALFAELGMGTAAEITVETTLNNTHGRVRVNAPEGTTVAIHLPTYGSVSAYKRFSIKNVGLGLVTLDAIDGKLVESLANKELYPGDGILVAKDGNNWDSEP